MDGKDGRSSRRDGRSSCRDGRSFCWTGRGQKSLPECRQWSGGWGVWKPSQKGQEPGVFHGDQEES